MSCTNDHDARRRRFIGVTVAVTGATLLDVVFPGSAAAEELPHLSETDPAATAFGYREDASTVDRNKYPRHAAGQMCANCKFFQPLAGADHAPCQLFPGKAVSAKGWCSQYSAKS